MSNDAVERRVKEDDSSTSATIDFFDFYSPGIFVDYLVGAANGSVRCIPKETE